MSYLDGIIPPLCMDCFVQVDGVWQKKETVWCGDSCEHFDAMMYSDIPELLQCIKEDSLQEPVWQLDK